MMNSVVPHSRVLGQFEFKTDLTSQTQKSCSDLHPPSPSSKSADIFWFQFSFQRICCWFDVAVKTTSASSQSLLSPSAGAHNYRPCAEVAPTHPLTHHRSDPTRPNRTLISNHPLPCLLLETLQLLCLLQTTKQRDSRTGLEKTWKTTRKKRRFPRTTVWKKL